MALQNGAELIRDWRIRAFNLHAGRKGTKGVRSTAREGALGVVARVVRLLAGVVLAPVLWLDLANEARSASESHACERSRSRSTPTGARAAPHLADMATNRQNNGMNRSMAIKNLARSSRKSL